jgi:hypothetical protein
MRLILAIAAVLVSIGVSAVAQQDNTFKVKPSRPEKAPKSAMPMGNAGNSKAGATSTSKDLQSLERQSAKASVPSRSAAKTKPASGAAPALKPVKDKPNPPINYNGKAGRTKTAGVAKQSPNPLQGRLKEKGGGH